MKRFALFVATGLFLSCSNAGSSDATGHRQPVPSSAIHSLVVTDSTSWAFFLQHLSQKEGAVLDYRGRPVGGQQKAFAVIAYDVGTRDLQQCADALMRLRAEYLFAQNRLSEISFHFVSGDRYAFTDYCNGKLPVAKGAGVVFIASSPNANDHASLRRYLDLVYNYASTISLATELKDADDFGIGTVVIKAGSPGHCFIIVDEAATASGEKLFKLVEGYTPAQTMYVLRNLEEPSLGYWHKLKKGIITTASYEFSHYQLKKFE